MARWHSTTELLPHVPQHTLPEGSWCGRRDLNSYAVRHRNLNPARLPFRHARTVPAQVGPSRLNRRTLSLHGATAISIRRIALTTFVIIHQVQFLVKRFFPNHTDGFLPFLSSGFCGIIQAVQGWPSAAGRRGFTDASDRGYGVCAGRLSESCGSGDGPCLRRKSRTSRPIC